MKEVCIALLPGIISHFWFFGWGTLFQIFLVCSSTIISEAIALKLRKMDIIYILNDKSALLTGLLLAISIPSLSPWWMGVLGGIFSIIIAKQFYGGLGCNIFNPAMVGYAVLLISFPHQIHNWISVYTINNFNIIEVINVIFNGKYKFTNMTKDISFLFTKINCVNQAALLDLLKISLDIRENYGFKQIIQKCVCDKRSLLYASFQLISLSYLVGGIFLLKKKVINWRIPTSFLTTFLVFALAHYVFFPNSLFLQKVYLFSGSTILSAFFILTDPVTSSITNIGCLISGILAGFLIWLIRSFGSYVDGTTFVILLTNAFVPAVDYFVLSRKNNVHKKDI